MLFSKKLGVLLVCAFFLGAVAIIATAQEETETLVIAADDVIDTMIPYRSTGASFSIPANWVYEGLCRKDPETYEPVPSAAKDWVVSEDGLTYTFHLHEGVKWQRDYGELTADDVVFTFNLHLDPEGDSVHKDTFWMVDKVEAVDDYTVKFFLKEPFAGFLYTVTLMHPGWGALLCKDAWEELGEEGYNENPVGAGPYEWIAEEYIPREVAVFEAFADYFKGKPEVDRIELRIITDEATQALGIESGDIDMAQIFDANRYLEHKDKEGIVGYRVSPVCVWKLDLNTQNPPLDKVEVRKALAYAIDTEAINQILFKGFSLRPNCNILHPDMVNVDSEPFEPIEQNLEKVEELLAEVGLEPADIEAEFVTLAKYQEVADILVTMFRNAGFTNVNITPMERGSYAERCLQPENDGAFVGHCRWPDPDPLLTLIHGDSIPPHGHNLTWWDKADDLIDKSRRTIGEERTQAITEIQRLLCEEMPQIPIYHGATFFLTTDRVKGAVLVANEFRPWTIHIED